MRAIVLGAAAGGGFPQWNSASEACRRARDGDAAAKPATQASIAVSADDEHWFVVNAAPDLRAQIEATPALHPRRAPRSTPIAGVALTNGDVDAIAGLVNLRESQPFDLWAHPRIHAILDANPVFEVLRRDIVRRRALTVGAAVALETPGGAPSGLEVVAHPAPGKSPLYLEGAAATDAAAEIGQAEGDTLVLELREPARGKRLVYAANLARIDEGLRALLDGADAAFVDGTLWTDDEMIRRGEGAKTGKRMGHVSMSGPDGAIARLAGLDIGRRVFIHVNNTNPALLADSPERREIEAAGWTVAEDGMEMTL